MLKVDSELGGPQSNFSHGGEDSPSMLTWF